MPQVSKLRTQREWHGAAPHLVRTLLFILIAGTIVALVGGAAFAQQPDARPELRIRLQFSRAGGIYDPAYWRYTPDSFANRGIFNSLVRMSPGTGGADLEPDLAKSWDVSDDSLVYTFHLNEGVQFHRGYGELTSDDVKFSFERQMADESASFHNELTNIASVESPSPYVVRIVLHEPQPSFIRSVVAFRPGLIVSRRAVEELGAEFALSPIGTGPYEFQELTEAGDVVLVSHDDYFKGRPDARGIRFVHVAEEAVVASALRTGELDIIYTRGNPEVAQSLLEDTEIEAVTVVEFYNLMQVQISPRFEPTQNVLVRRALAHAIDKSVFPALLPGLDEPAHVMRPPEVAGGTDDVVTYPYDPDRARQLLQEAGYGDGFTLGLMFPMNAPNDVIAQFLAESWAAVGVDVRLEGVDATTLFDRSHQLDFDVTFAATSRFGDPDFFFTNVFHSDSVPPGGSNYIGYAAADELIEAARTELDEARRDQMYVELQQQLMEDLPIIPLLYRAYGLRPVPSVNRVLPGP